jgi:hypothetical protein
VPASARKRERPGTLLCVPFQPLSHRRAMILFALATEVPDAGPRERDGFATAGTEHPNSSSRSVHVKLPQPARPTGQAARQGCRRAAFTRARPRLGEFSGVGRSFRRPSPASGPSPLGRPGTMTKQSACCSVQGRRSCNFAVAGTPPRAAHRRRGAASGLHDGRRPRRGGRGD